MKPFAALNGKIEGRHPGRVARVCGFFMGKKSYI